MLSHLGKCGVLTRVGSHYVIVRKPDHDDGFACTTASMTEQNRIFEQAFHYDQPAPAACRRELLRTAACQSRGRQSGSRTGISLKFERYNLIKNEKRGQWSMKQFDQAYAEQLFELREMLETHSCNIFSICPTMTHAGCKRKRCWSATGSCATASAAAFVCSRS